MPQLADSDLVVCVKCLNKVAKRAFTETDTFHIQDGGQAMRYANKLHLNELVLQHSQLCGKLCKEYKYWDLDITDNIGKSSNIPCNKCYTNCLVF